MDFFLLKAHTVLLEEKNISEKKKIKEEKKIGDLLEKRIMKILRSKCKNSVFSL